MESNNLTGKYAVAVKRSYESIVGHHWENLENLQRQYSIFKSK